MAISVMTTAITEINTWILLRGLSREQRHWGRFLVKLREAFPQIDFLCLDLPGTGELYREPSPWSVGAIRRHLQQQCRAANIPAPFGIMGLSLGGMVALDWMAASDEVVAVVVMGSSSNDCPLRYRFNPRAMWLGGRAFLSSHIEQRERLVLRMGSRRHAGDEATIAQWIDIQRQQPVSRDTVIKQLLAAARFSLAANRYRCPGLVLASDRDTMVSSRCSDKIAGFYHWPLRCHTEAGHDLPLDDPDWVVEQFRQWREQSEKLPD